MRAQRVPPQRSLRALDGLNFMLSELCVGLGPFLSSYLLAVHHWSQGEIGIAMSAAGISTIVLQAPAGYLIDRSQNKIRLLTLSVLTMGLATVCVSISTSFTVVILAQVLFGAAGSLLGPTIHAVSLGLVGPDGFSKRVGRNSALEHVGTVGWTLISGGIAQYYSPQGIYWVSIMVCLLTAFWVVRSIHNNEIDNSWARAAPQQQPADQKVHMATFFELVNDRKVLLLGLTFCLFHFANAPMLSLVGQYLSQIDPESWALYQSWCMVLAQMVMVPVAVVSGKWAPRLGGRSLMLFACSVLPIRGVLYTISVNPKFILAVEALDGLAIGIYGVVGILMMRTLSQGTGRFNALVGLMTTAISLGAASANAVSGYIAERFGFNASMFLLSAAAVASLITLCAYTEPPVQEQSTAS